MSSSRIPQRRQPEPPQAPPVAPFTPGHSIKLLNALSAEPQSNKDRLNPLMVPAGTVGEVRKSRTIEIKANLAASTSQGEPNQLAIYVYSLLFKMRHEITREYSYDDKKDRVNHDNLRSVNNFSTPPNKTNFRVDDVLYVVNDFIAGSGTNKKLIKSGSQIRVIADGVSKDNLSRSIKSNLFYGFSVMITTHEDVEYHTAYVPPDRFQAATGSTIG